MNKSSSIGNLAKALVAFQGKVGKIKKDAKNPFFKSNYASLSNIQDEIQEPLTESGLAYCQLPDGDEGLTTIIMHAESGEFLEATYSIHAAKKDPQGLGSAITYARRYALCAALGLNVEDDDGNSATKAKQEEEKRKAEELANAISHLSRISNADELRTFGESLPDSIRKHNDFRNAATSRQKSFNVAMAAQ